MLEYEHLSEKLNEKPPNKHHEEYSWGDYYEIGKCTAVHVPIAAVKRFKDNFSELRESTSRDLRTK